jgi:hypothetical protein
MYPTTVLRARVRQDDTGAYIEVPGIFTRDGWLMPLMDYVVQYSQRRSASWQAKLVRSVRMFMQYLATNPYHESEHQLFLAFANRLYTGSYDRKTGLDPSWL